MQPADIERTFYRGADFAFYTEWEEDGSPLDLTQYDEITLTVYNPNSKKEEHSFQYSKGEIQLSGTSNEVMSAALDEEQTKALKFSHYLYEVLFKKGEADDCYEVGQLKKTDVFDGGKVESSAKIAIDSQTLQATSSGASAHIAAGIATRAKEDSEQLKADTEQLKADTEQVASQALTDITSAKDSALSQLSTKETEAINAIETAESNGIDAVNGAKTQGVTAVESARDSAISTINGLVTQAETARDEAVTAKNQAATSASNAATSETNAASSATAASESATTATTQADRAETEADRAESEANSAQTTAETEVQAKRIQDAAFYINQHYALKDMSLANLPIPEALLPPQPNLIHPLLNFTRSSKATRWNAKGELEEVPEGELRFDYDPATGAPKGWLIEEQRTNSILDSRDMTTGNWDEGGSIDGANRDAIGIDGNPNTACTITDDDESNIQRVQQNIPITDDSKTHTVGVYVKKDEINSRYPVLAISLTGGTNVRHSVAVNTDTGDISALDWDDGEGFVEDVGNFWLVWCRVTNNGTGNTNLEVRLYPAGSENGSVFEATATGSAVFDQAQVELNASFPTSPIITEGKAVTRSADIPGFTDLPWYNQQEGTFVVEYELMGIASGNVQPVWSLNDGTANERVTLWADVGTGTCRVFFGSDSGDNQTFQLSSSPLGRKKIAVSWDKGGLTSVVNGNIIHDESIDIPIPSVDRFNIGRDHTARYMNGHIKPLFDYPRRLSNSQLQALTS